MQNLQEQLAELRLQQTEYKVNKVTSKQISSFGERNNAQLEVEEHQLQLLIEQGDAQVRTVDVRQLANQLTQRLKARKRTWNKGYSGPLSWMICWAKMWQNRWNK